MSSIHKYDSRIIQLLEQNSRRSFNDISKKLELSEPAFRKRVVALHDEGVIKKFTIQVNSAKLIANNVSIVGVEVEPRKLLEVAQKL